MCTLVLLSSSTNCGSRVPRREAVQKHEKLHHAKKRVQLSATPYRPLSYPKVGLGLVLAWHALGAGLLVPSSNLFMSMHGVFSTAKIPIKASHRVILKLILRGSGSQWSTHLCSSSLTNIIKAFDPSYRAKVRLKLAPLPSGTLAGSQALIVALETPRLTSSFPSWGAQASEPDHAHKYHRGINMPNDLWYARQDRNEPCGRSDDLFMSNALE